MDTAAAQARREYETRLANTKFEENLETMDPMSARNKADKDSKDVMSTMAALHNLDQITGGIKSGAPMDIGLKNVNSSIGSQWKTRVQALDEAAAKVPVSERSTTGMNAKLERCKK